VNASPTERPDLPCAIRRAGFWTVILVGLLVAGAGRSKPVRAKADERTGLGLPVDCSLGAECFVQQMPDIGPGVQVLDPLCGNASYQGHDGWDIRVRSLKDISRRIPVVSVADGVVVRTRDGAPDQILDRSDDKGLLLGRECGNGLVVEHAEGLVSQYCHLKQGSVAVGRGAHIRKGERIGMIGASGLAEFPHVHLSIRSYGRPVEPLTGRPLGQTPAGCGDTTHSLFEPTARQMLSRSPAAILDTGLAKAPPELSNLLRDGGPPLVKSSEPIIVWVWAINLDRGCLFRIRLTDPDQNLVMDFTTKPLERHKANYLAYVGGKYAIREGLFRLQIEIVNGAQIIQSIARSFKVVS
jgi:hypothetical protein